MTVKEIAEKLPTDIKACRDALDREVTGGYVSDMLSDVLAHAQKGSLWITLQTHLNIVAVAGMKELAGIIITNGRSPDGETLRKAEEEKLPILVTPLTSFEVAGRLYALVTPGTKR